jgi:hypothetical protein
MPDRRKIDRSDVDLVAYIFGDGGSRRCRAFNISKDGAGIEVTDEAAHASHIQDDVGKRPYHQRLSSRLVQ